PLPGALAARRHIPAAKGAQSGCRLNVMVRCHSTRGLRSSRRTCRGFKRFLKSDPPRYTRYLSEFYDNLAILETAFADINAARALGDVERAHEAREKAGGKLVWRKTYTKAREAISKIDRAISLTHASKTMTAAA